MSGAAPDASVRYRVAQAADCDRLAAFAEATFRATFAHLYRPEDLAAFVAASYTPAGHYVEIIDPARDTMLAERDGALVAYAQGGPLTLPIAPLGGEPAYELKRLYVDAALHGAGVADALMDAIEARADARGAAAIYLGVYADNPRAQRFYTRRGFAKVGAYRFPVGAAYDDEWIMRRPLSRW
jgi:ribosomal protein S18 acetylase RimI-like enzyme